MKNWRVLLLASVALAVLVGVTLLEPIPQDPDYHVFADQRAFLGIPNFLNVISNLPFLLFGAMGLRLIARYPDTVSSETRFAWKIFFFGIALTAFGSGYFHWLPNNGTLVWDRLPMTIGFMSLVSIVASEYLSPRLGSRLLLPLLLVGATSVAYWAYTESRGAGDLRPYAIVQFLPMLLIPLTIVLYRERSNLGQLIWWMIGFYFLAKLFEYYDFAIFAMGDAISGHSIKHIAASLAPAALLYGLMRKLKAR